MSTKKTQISSTRRLSRARRGGRSVEFIDYHDLFVRHDEHLPCIKDNYNDA